MLIRGHLKQENRPYNLFYIVAWIVLNKLLEIVFCRPNFLKPKILWNNLVGLLSCSIFTCLLLSILVHES